MFYRADASSNNSIRDNWALKNLLSIYTTYPFLFIKLVPFYLYNLHLSISLTFRSGSGNENKKDTVETKRKRETNLLLLKGKKKQTKQLKRFIKEGDKNAKNRC